MEEKVRLKQDQKEKKEMVNKMPKIASKNK